MEGIIAHPGLIFKAISGTVWENPYPMHIIFISVKDYLPKDMVSLIKTYAGESHQYPLLFITPAAREFYGEYRAMEEFDKTIVERFVSEPYIAKLAIAVDEYRDGHHEDVIMVLSDFHNALTIHPALRPVYESHDGYTLGWKKIGNCRNSYHAFAEPRFKGRVRAGTGAEDVPFEPWP